MYRTPQGIMGIYVEKPEFEQYEKHYNTSYVGYDPDLDALPPDELEQRKKQYGERILYNGTRWVCQPAGIDRVTKLLEEQNILLSNVVRIYKRINGYWR